ncbi:MAG: hypothetical protein JW786_06785 [Desulfobacterales bacterium]|nr:hypothetical protein [Desulfobacterales bacterium]
MIIIPKEKPVIENLNSYYLNVPKLFEHYQGEIGAGGIHFKSPAAEGVVFFDKDDFLNGFFHDKTTKLSGKNAIDCLIEPSSKFNFCINIYRLDSGQVYFWANMPDAKKIYKNLSTEFTNLEALIKKMSSEKLTGYIDVLIKGENERGLIFFINGEIIGGSYSWGKGELSTSEESRERLIKKTKEYGGTFDVNRILLTKRKEKEEGIESISKLEELLNIFEDFIRSNKKNKLDFNTLLRKKFVQKVEQYAFLDPFTAEFEYLDRKIKFVGDAGEDDLFKGVTESVKELADELDTLPQFTNVLSSWSEKYRQDLERLAINF